MSRRPSPRGRRSSAAEQSFSLCLSITKRENDIVLTFRPSTHTPCRAVIATRSHTLKKRLHNQSSGLPQFALRVHSCADMPGDDDTPTLWVIWGSQYVAKALVALDAHGIKHYVRRGKLGTGGLEDLPGGGKLVPVLTAGNDVVVPDSEAILRWAEKTRGANLYPTPRCAEWSQRASDGFLPNAVLYYNWIEPQGYARSMRAKLSSLVPWYVGGGTYIAGYLVDWGVSKKRADFAASVLPELVQAPGRGDTDGPRRCRRQRGRRARGAGQGAHALSVGSRDGGWGRVPVRRRLAHRGGLFGVRSVGEASRDDGRREGARVGAGSVGRCAVGGD